jgi:hypothetical protein
MVSSANLTLSYQAPNNYIPLSYNRKNVSLQWREQILLNRIHFLLKPNQPGRSFTTFILTSLLDWFLESYIARDLLWGQVWWQLFTNHLAMLKDFQHENQFSTIFDVIDVRVSWNIWPPRKARRWTLLAPILFNSEKYFLLEKH